MSDDLLSQLQSALAESLDKWEGFLTGTESPTYQGPSELRAERHRERIQVLRELCKVQHHFTAMSLCSNDVVMPSAVAMIVARPQVEGFQGTHFGVSPACGPKFRIEDIRVGNLSTFPQSQALAGDFFVTPVSNLGMLLARDGKVNRSVTVDTVAPVDWTRLVGRPWKFPICMTAQDLVVIATNVSKEPFPFVGWAFGYETKELPQRYRGW